MAARWAAAAARAVEVMARAESAVAAARAVEVMARAESAGAAVAEATWAAVVPLVAAAEAAEGQVGAGTGR